MLDRQLYIQSQSFDEVVKLCKENDEKLKCIPAIQPVANKDLKYTASGYGLRIDPIYNTTKFTKAWTSPPISVHRSMPPAMAW